MNNIAFDQIYAYPERKVFGQPKRRERQTLTFAVNRFLYFDLNLEIANKWKAAILKLKSNRDKLPVDPTTVRIRRVVVEEVVVVVVVMMNEVGAGNWEMFWFFSESTGNGADIVLLQLYGDSGRE